MKTQTADGNGTCGAQSRTAIYRAIHWLEKYIEKNPDTDAAVEARRIIRELEGLRVRPVVDELLALIGQIAKSDLGLEEISRAKIRMSQPENNRRRNETIRDWHWSPANVY